MKFAISRYKISSTQDGKSLLNVDVIDDLKIPYRIGDCESEKEADNKSFWLCVCSECHEFFDSRELLETHRLNFHSSDSKEHQQFSKQQSCENERSINSEIVTGEQSYKCNLCDKCFTRKRSLIAHHRAHTRGKESYKCDVCNKSFVHRCIFIIHSRTHTAEKPYRCSRCYKGFNYKCTLIKHQTIHTGEKPYKCDTCDKSFLRKDALVFHYRSHTRENR